MNSGRRLLIALCLSGLLAPAAKASPPASPRWAQLSAEQQQVLAPLATEWDRYAPYKKQNLLAIVPQFQQLPEAQRQRVQQKLKAWSELSQQQRDEIRANWKALQQMPPEQRQQAIQRLRQQHEAQDASR
ncbi:putative Fe-S protein YdhL (DUF1289 family) [Chromobacterium alkanivorans]|uniref:DUF3106 domain-containing protein n=1 Tax=Chromobacterium alkanivorans TaxID=1071719 RepID=UPI002167BE87|nr:DUF3106 domain-containing protein [Chromobacterium alkanivorans]MCS3803397.1 putative Fe-S protein YdhL (DUF1289 family) [Chromobacterium alkanivorans]MCS3817493.1 putative Fe-S protein YdhL (DUF1289 family) [Chromobacterium alkanivorans]MCS3872763.1 putative Fe-S protein YdhL (DUF1289 family) [Chromobacterium alkanivorans]